jgi:hypothetical protein
MGFRRNVMSKMQILSLILYFSAHSILDISKVYGSSESIELPANPVQVLNPALEYLRLIEEISKDELYFHLKNEEQRMVDLYNGREFQNVTQLDFTLLNSLREQFREKFQSKLLSVAIGFADKFPEQVLWRSNIDLVGNTYVVFKANSPLYEAFNYDVLAQKAQDHISGHRIQNYRSFVAVAKNVISQYFIGNKEMEIYAEIIDQIEADQLYQQLMSEERKQVVLYNNRENAGAAQPDFKFLNELREKFISKYKERIHLLRYIFSLKYPDQVLHKIETKEGFPFVIFKNVSSLEDALNIDVLGHSDQGHIGGHRIRNYRPFIEIAKEFLGRQTKINAKEARSFCHNFAKHFLK